MTRTSSQKHLALYALLSRKIEGGIEITEGVFWGGDFEQAKELISNYQLTENEIKFLRGTLVGHPSNLTKKYYRIAGL